MNRKTLLKEYYKNASTFEVNYLFRSNKLSQSFNATVFDFLGFSLLKVFLMRQNVSNVYFPVSRFPSRCSVQCRLLISEVGHESPSLQTNLTSLLRMISCKEEGFLFQWRKKYMMTKCGVSLTAIFVTKLRDGVGANVQSV